MSDGPSLYDHFGSGLTLLVTNGPTNDDPLAAPTREAAGLGIPLTILAPSEPALPGLYQARLALIRPDQHVAWRGDRLPNPRLLLLRVTGNRPD